MMATGKFLSRDASESEVLDNWLTWHATSADWGEDTLSTINSAANSTFLLNSRFATEQNSRFSTEHIGNTLLGLIGADGVPLTTEDRFKSFHNISDIIEPADFLSVFLATSI
ncbi:hypothetical protein POM88_012183 [Heracleum sosnowskyi]|uniref:Uncharacterized protein n=1 Tax=Heracleum sosnowskyi TaxID=360622 RepID=A0AAD8IVZ5_9APIA|nr:hypothetical protein POM88_012183 [Heracleum sosnowskyi]